MGDEQGVGDAREGFTEEMLTRGPGGCTRGICSCTGQQEECGCGPEQRVELGGCQQVVLEGGVLGRV